MAREASNEELLQLLDNPNEGRAVYIRGVRSERTLSVNGKVVETKKQWVELPCGALQFTGSNRPGDE
jgi:hypothetical protein